MTKTLQAITDAKNEGWADWIRSEADERAVRDGCWFDEAAGRRRVDLIEKHFKLTMAPWTGQPFKLMDWQRDQIVLPLYGWKKDKSRPHLRRYSKGDVFVAKKNGKSTLCGALGVAELLVGGARSEIYGAAHVREQAAIIYREAASIVRANSEIEQRFKVLDNAHRIVHRTNASFYRVLAGENHAGGIEGINPTLVLFDEVHVQRNRKFYDGLVYAGSARANSLLLSVSTVGVVDEHAIWWELWEYAKGILDGSLTDHARFAYIATADEEVATNPELRRDRSQWLKANPSLGQTVQEDKFLEDLIEAENEPRKLYAFLRYRFNQPVGVDDPALDVAAYKELGTNKLPDLSWRMCYGGLDMASTEDLCAFVLWFPPVDNEKGVLLGWHWAPSEKMLERERKGYATYQTWSKGGWIIEVPGACIEHEPIAEKILELSSMYDIREIGYDQYNAAPVTNALEREGLLCTKIIQGFSQMSPGCIAFSKAIATGSFVHDRNPVLTWCVGNAVADSRSSKEKGEFRFDKNHSKDKIDGAVAAAMAFGRWVANQNNEDDGQVKCEFVNGGEEW